MVPTEKHHEERAVAEIMEQGPICGEEEMLRDVRFYLAGLSFNIKCQPHIARLVFKLVEKYVSGLPYESDESDWEMLLNVDSIENEVQKNSWGPEDIQLRSCETKNSHIIVEVSSPTPWGLSAAVGLLISIAMANSEGVLLHASGLVRNGLAYLFLGPSGAGKSTIVHNSIGMQIMHDDRMAVIRKGETWRAYSPPLVDNLGFLPVPNDALLGAIFVLEKGDVFAIQQKKSRRLLADVFAQTIFPVEDRNLKIRCIDTVLGLLEDGIVSKLIFQKDSDFGELIE